MFRGIWKRTQMSKLIKHKWQLRCRESSLPYFHQYKRPGDYFFTVLLDQAFKRDRRVFQARGFNETAAFISGPRSLFLIDYFEGAVDLRLFLIPSHLRVCDLGALPPRRPPNRATMAFICAFQSTSWEALGLSSPYLKYQTTIARRRLRRNCLTDWSLDERQTVRST